MRARCTAALTRPTRAGLWRSERGSGLPAGTAETRAARVSASRRAWRRSRTRLPAPVHAPLAMAHAFQAIVTAYPGRRVPNPCAAGD
ncbi:hypothetical protein G6F40_018181 [Rhizopus arrhizus]|nr:hypothetical protein G6F40_018181 [Rhizopus arrhizus]